MQFNTSKLTYTWVSAPQDLQSSMVLLLICKRFSQTRALKRSCHVIIISAYWHFPPRFSTKEILNILRSLVPVFREIKIEVLHPDVYLSGRLVIDANGYERTVDDWALRYSDSHDCQDLRYFLQQIFELLGERNAQLA